MENLHKDIVQYLSNFLSINEMAKLKQTCKHFNKYINFVTFHLYSCVIDKNKIPIDADKNCLKVVIRRYVTEFEKIKEKFYSQKYRLFSLVIWKNLKKRNEEEEIKMGCSFLSTNILIKNELKYDNFIITMEFNIVKNENLEKILKYVEKEIRYIQEEVWDFPYYHLTSLTILNECILQLKCVDGEILDNTILVFENLSKIFDIKIPEIETLNTKLIKIRSKFHRIKNYKTKLSEK